MTKPIRGSTHLSGFLNGARVCLFLVLAGCSDKDITSYRVPKDPAAAAAVGEPSVAGTAEQSGLHWQAPAGWQIQPATGMRAASYLAPGDGGARADVSVVTFAGAGGGALENINRWRGQLKLPATTAEELSSGVIGIDGPAGHFNFADISSAPSEGEQPRRILGAWLEQSGRVWFFKMMGPGNVVAAQRDAFLGFLQSVVPGAAANGQSAPLPSAAVPVSNTNDLPHPAFMVASSGADAGAALTWQAPAEWLPKAASSMRMGSYAVSRDGIEADLSITAFPGDVGGLDANINRWRGQVGLQPADDAVIAAQTEAIDSNGLHFTIVDIAGPGPSGQQRIMAALATWQGATWFFKMTGPSGLVESEKPAFDAFLRSVRPR